MLIGSDHGLSRLQCLPYTLVGGIEPAYKFDHDVHIALEYFMEVVRPLDGLWYPRYPLSFDVAIEYVREPQVRFTGENVGHRTSDGTET
jgi:hypothetical protein